MGIMTVSAFPNQGISSKQTTSQLFTLILQHPQEPGIELGSTPIIGSILKNVKLRTGLSWSNLASAARVDFPISHKRWIVLYLGTGHKNLQSYNIRRVQTESQLIEVDKKGGILGQINKTQKESIDGLVLLDGTWSQSKTMWWRNPWLLKLRRAILLPNKRSLYGQLRKEPRPECLSTLEAVVETYSILEVYSELQSELLMAFEKFIVEKRHFGEVTKSLF